MAVEAGRPVAGAPARPRPKREREEEVLVWPDLVFIEFIAAVLFTITFLNLQELLLHMDKAWAGVILPTIALGFFAVIPYLDRSRAAQGIWFGTKNSVKLTIVAAVYAVAVSVFLVVVDAGDRTHTEYATRWIPSCDAEAQHAGWPCLKDEAGARS